MEKMTGITRGPAKSAISDSLKWRQVTWTLPKPMYDLLKDLQERLLDGMTKHPRWESVEALALHLLRIAVREAYKEIAVKAQESRLIKLPGEV